MKYIDRYMHANFNKLYQLIFVGRDRFSMKIKFKNSNIFTDFDKIDNFEGSENSRK